MRERWPRHQINSYWVRNLATTCLAVLISFSAGAKEVFNKCWYCTAVKISLTRWMIAISDLANKWASHEGFLSISTPILRIQVAKSSKCGIGCHAILKYNKRNNFTFTFQRSKFWECHRIKRKNDFIVTNVNLQSIKHKVILDPKVPFLNTVLLPFTFQSLQLAYVSRPTAIETSRSFWLIPSPRFLDFCFLFTLNSDLKGHCQFLVF